MKKKYALFGKGISYSLSPSIQGAIAAYYGRDLDYEIVDVDSVDEILTRLKSGVYAGANVTVPYKVALLPHMDALDPSAEACGALNTVRVEEGRLIGYNTDSEGFLDVLTLHSYSLEEKRVLVYGTGGVARGLVNALLDSPVKGILLDGRNQEAKIEVFRTFEQKSHDRLTVVYGLHGLLCDLAVNASTLGSASVPGLPIDLEKMDAEAVYEVIYHPLETELVRSAKERGLPVFTGLEMLICQAIRAFYLWYPELAREQLDPDLFQAVRRKLEEELALEGGK